MGTEVQPGVLTPQLPVNKGVSRILGVLYIDKDLPNLSRYTVTGGTTYYLRSFMGVKKEYWYFVYIYGDTFVALLSLSSGSQLEAVERLEVCLVQRALLANEGT